MIFFYDAMMAFNFGLVATDCVMAFLRINLTCDHYCLIFFHIANIYFSDGFSENHLKFVLVIK